MLWPVINGLKYHTRKFILRKGSSESLKSLKQGHDAIRTVSEKARNL